MRLGIIARKIIYKDGETPGYVDNRLIVGLRRRPVFFMESVNGCHPCGYAKETQYLQRMEI